MFQEHLALMGATNVTLFLINVHCEQEALERRITSSERLYGAKTKVTDVALVRKLVSEQRLIAPRTSGLGPVNLIFETVNVNRDLETSASHLMQIVRLLQSTNPT